MGILKKELNYPHEWDVSLENIKYIFSGKASLRAAFFGLFVITSLLIVLTPLIMLVFYSNFVGNFELMGWYSKNMDFFFAGVRLFMIYPVVLCSKNTDNRYWPIVAIVFSIIIVVMHINDAINNI